jgi:hypothetical protein
MLFTTGIRPCRVGQKRTYKPYMTVYVVISLPKLLCIFTVYLWFWPTLVGRKIIYGVRKRFWPTLLTSLVPRIMVLNTSIFSFYLSSMIGKRQEGLFPRYSTPVTCVCSCDQPSLPPTQGSVIRSFGTFNSIIRVEYDAAYYTNMPYEASLFQPSKVAHHSQQLLENKHLSIVEHTSCACTA